MTKDSQITMGFLKKESTAEVVFFYTLFLVTEAKHSALLREWGRRMSPCYLTHMCANFGFCFGTLYTTGFFQKELEKNW